MKHRSVFVMAALLMCARGASAVDVPTAEDCLKTLDRGHPRLFLKDTRLSELKALSRTDKVLQKCVTDMISRADSYVPRTPVVYKLIGPRLLSVSRECFNRVITCSLAYRWTGQDKYATAAVANMLAVCEFKDWNPSHYLDTAEMSNAVGVGYDWLYHYMDAATREKIKAGLIRHGMEVGVKCYTGKIGDKNHWFVSSEHNWNQVCNGGMIVGALAIADSDPQYAEIIIPAAVKSLPLALKSYAPDGSWMEGPGYWSYATRYTAYGIDALLTALGTDFGLLAVDGLNNAGLAPIYTVGPTEMYLCYADCGGKNVRRPMPCMFWLGRMFDNPVIVDSERDQIAEHSASAEHVMWYVPAVKQELPARQLDRHFRSGVELALFRSAWDDHDALFVGTKAGYNQVNHGHLDLGNFELDALGVRWAVDLGRDDYNMPGYWSKGRGGKRWSYYRLNSHSHNVPLLGDRDQDPYATSKFIKVKKGGDPFVLVDLAEAYAGQAKQSVRGVKMIERRAVLVQDEFTIETPCSVAWAMTTEATVAVKSNGTARLTQAGKALIARILAPAGANFTVESAEQNPPQKLNRGIRRLMVRLPETTTGNVRIAVLLSPVWEDRTLTRATVSPLEKW